MALIDQINELLGCMCVALGEVGWEGDCCSRPGAVSFDQCCESGGQAWIRVMRIYPSEHFPQQSGPVVPDRDVVVQWVAQIELGATVCVCFDMCDCDVAEANTAKVLAIAEAGLAGVLCCDVAGCSDFAVSALETLDPDGGCGGFTIIAYLGMNVCCPT